MEDGFSGDFVVRTKFFPPCVRVRPSSTVVDLTTSALRSLKMLRISLISKKMKTPTPREDAFLTYQRPFYSRR